MEGRQPKHPTTITKTGRVSIRTCPGSPLTTHPPLVDIAQTPRQHLTRSKYIIKPTHESSHSQMLAEVGQTALNQSGCYSVLPPRTTPGCQVVTPGSVPEKRLDMGELSHMILEVARRRTKMRTAENSQTGRTTSEDRHKKETHQSRSWRTPFTSFPDHPLLPPRTTKPPHNQSHTTPHSPRSILSVPHPNYDSRGMPLHGNTRHISGFHPIPLRKQYTYRVRRCWLQCMIAWTRRWRRRLLRLRLRLR